MATYRGLSVLEVEPGRSDGSSLALSRDVRALESLSGARSADVWDSGSRARGALHWQAVGRSEAADMRAFVTAQVGRAVPFWLPSWNSDFALVSPYAPGDGRLKVAVCGYSDNVFPLGGYRRHLGVLVGGSWTYRGLVAAAAFPGDREDLYLDAELPVALALSPAPLLSLLAYSRLDTDEPSIAWDGGFYAECDLPFVEIPAEAPTP